MHQDKSQDSLHIGEAAHDADSHCHHAYHAHQTSQASHHGTPLPPRRSKSRTNRPHQIYHAPQGTHEPEQLSQDEGIHKQPP